MEKNTETVKRTISIDDFIKDIGEFGRYQKILDAIICILILPAYLHPIIMYFGTLTPEWECIKNSSICILNGTFPGDDSRRCHISRHEWHYMESKYFSVVTEFDLHCDKKWMLHLLSSMFFVGWGSGAVIIGRLADKYGRKKFIFPSVTIMIVVGFVTPLMPNVYLIILCRFIVGFFYPGVAIQAYILMSELVGNKKRPLATGLQSTSFPTSWIFVAVVAYLTKNWKTMSFVCSAPFLFVLVFYKYIPESIRWLQLNGRVDEAMNILHQAARVNKKELSSDLTLRMPTQGDSRKSSLIDIFRTRRVALSSFVQIYLWMFVAMGMYGLQLAAGDLEGSVYRDFALLCVVEYPAVCLSIILSNKLGRKKGTLIPFFMAGSACLGIAFIPENGTWKIARITLGLIGKLCIATAFTNLYLWSAEIFPTGVRAEALGLMQVSSRIGSASSPWIANGLKSYGTWIPFFIMGITPLIGSLLGILLPETRNRLMDKAVQPSEYPTDNPEGSYENKNVEMNDI